MRSRRSGSGRPLGDTKESDRRVTCKAPLGPTWNEGQASPRRRPQPFSRILTAWKGNSANFAFWGFSEVGFPLYGVLGSSLPASNAQATPKIAHLSDTPAPIGDYATPVTDKGTL